MAPPESASGRTSWLAMLGATARQALTALAVGALLWGPLLLFSQPACRFPDPLARLLLVMGTQVGCLLVALQGRRGRPSRKGSGAALHWLPAGVAGMLLAVGFGLAYDQVVRALRVAPTIGPWGAARAVDAFAAGLIVVADISIGPLGDELFFRAGLFRAWVDAGIPRLGAVVSSLLFALSRLDAINFPAYVGLGLLLCVVYHRAGSVLAPLTTTVLLNGVMFALLFSGYQ